ncbi:calcium-activated chloride channel regulator 1-like [Dendropsophus ebraccatus]|uniref:calcium-activated chloride channel regulator 1-like n=1 Tax=Dendropsophus ebraccatus TaxID=150705 RepID=UPI003830FE0E
MGLGPLLPLFLLFPLLAISSSSQVKLNNGGYQDIVIAINPAVPEDPKIIENLQKMIKEASSYLFSATRKRLFIQSAKILIPMTWRGNKKYQKTKTESYEKADVIVADPHMKNGDDPYTLQYGQCGEKGKYIHFTPNFLVDDNLLPVYGPRGRVFVHEWAHLRWGVFDEYNSMWPFYFTYNNNTQKIDIEATRCSVELQGVHIKENCTGDMCQCERNKKTGLYEDGCVFVPYKNATSKHSIMYLQAVTSVSEFCDAQSHNTEAINQQNRMCNHRSTWEVIMDSADIKNTPASSNTNIPEPTVTLLQASERMVILVFDVSGSMAANERDLRLVRAAETIILQIVEMGSHVGLVEFNSLASILYPMVQIITNEQRWHHRNAIKRKASGDKNICEGIMKALEVIIRSGGSSTYSSEIILLSDGEDPSFPSGCYDEIIKSEVIIHVIMLGPNATAALEEMATETGGLTFFATDSFHAQDLVDAFASMASGSGDISRKTVQLENTASTITGGECLQGSVFIDETVGNDTFFWITWQSELPSINVLDPVGTQYTIVHFMGDRETKTASMEVTETAEVRVVSMNPPRPVIDEEQLVVDTFSRTASGGSFVISNIPANLPMDIYKPEKITDLDVWISLGGVDLAWTATGDELDQGTATSYDLRMSFNPKDLRENFDGSTKVDISSVSPKEAGNREFFWFKPENVIEKNVIENGTILYFALVATDKADKRSDVSNIAQAALVIPPTPALSTTPTTTSATTTPAPTTPVPTTNDCSNRMNGVVITLIVCSAVTLITLII